jgi:hypothetical protein
MKKKIFITLGTEANGLFFVCRRVVKEITLWVGEKVI